MTRINASYPVKQLTDKHLLAEHREIKRIPNNILSGKAIIKDIPNQFTLGKGHVKFFYNKIKYLHERYLEIRNECYRRGFNITDYESCFVALKETNLYNDWHETKEAYILISERIKERLAA